MPFVALDKSTGGRVDITKIDNPRAILKSGEVVCQLCGSPMMIKAVLIKRHHFAHYASSECQTDYDHHPESPEHLAAKEKVAEALRRDFDEYTTAEIEYEYRLPEIKRIADIMVIFPNGWRVVHEIQLASITTEELRQRTDDYARAGIDSFWWLGKSADTPANRLWCIERYGVVYTLFLGKLYD